MIFCIDRKRVALIKSATLFIYRFSSGILLLILHIPQKIPHDGTVIAYLCNNTSFMYNYQKN